MGVFEQIGGPGGRRIPEFNNSRVLWEQKEKTDV